MTRTKASLGRVSVPDITDLITLQEGSTEVGVSVRTLRNWIYRDLLTLYKLGPRLVRIDRNQLKAIATPVDGKGVA